MDTQYNWSELDRTSLYSMFYSLNKQVVGKRLSSEQIHRKIRKHLKGQLPIRIKKCIDSKIEKNHVYTGGCYYSDRDYHSKASIEINYSYHPDTESLKLTNYKWSKLSRRFADVMLHEIIHMRQFRARNFKSLPGYQSTAASTKERKEQEYYGDTDEMGAFAFNIACEMLDVFGYDPTAISQYMDSKQVNRNKNSWWYQYLKVFNWNHDHQIIRRMKRKVLLQLENAYYGKPFRTTTWLTY